MMVVWKRQCGRASIVPGATALYFVLTQVVIPCLVLIVEALFFEYWEWVSSMYISLLHEFYCHSYCILPPIPHAFDVPPRF